MNTDTKNQDGGAARSHGSLNIPWHCLTCKMAGDLTLLTETTIAQISKAIQCLHSPVCSGSAVIGALPSPPNGQAHPSFGPYGCPTEETEWAIADWDFRDAAGWLAYIREAWNHNHGRIWHQDGLLKMATGGWSGNEAIVEAMRRNSLLWSFMWDSSRRGGLEVLRVGEVVP